MKRVIALAALVLLLGTMASTATPVAEGNKALVRRYVGQVLNGRRLEALGELLAPNYKRYLSPTAAPLNPAEQKQRLAGLFAAFPDALLTIDDLIAVGDLVAYRTAIRATHRGTFLGIAPTGKKVEVSELAIIRIENGKFVEHWGGPDIFSLLQQLGAVVSPPPK